jgi:hypothetical protein
MATLIIPEDAGDSYNEWEDRQARQEIEDWENRSAYGVEW